MIEIRSGPHLADMCGKGAFVVLVDGLIVEIV